MIKNVFMIVAARRVVNASRTLKERHVGSGWKWAFRRDLFDRRHELIGRAPRPHRKSQRYWINLLNL